MSRGSLVVRLLRVIVPLGLLLVAFALTTTSYTTGQSITWVQGRDVVTWERPGRVTRQCRLTLDHVMPRHRGGGRARV